MHVEEGCFDPENKLIFMAGLLTGTASPSASRYSVVARSPLTGIWGHANSGGEFGAALKRSGYDGIIFVGVSPSPVYLRIVDGHAELCDAGELQATAQRLAGRADAVRIPSSVSQVRLSPSNSA